MATIDFNEALLAAGFSTVEQLHDAERWQLWRAKEQRTFTVNETFIVLLTSRATWSISEEVRSAIARLLPRGASYHAVVRPSADIAADLTRIAKDFGALSAVTVRELVRAGLSWRLRAENLLALDHPFVDPTIETSDRSKTRRAVAYLAEWLEHDSGFGTRLGVLLAPAGVGKTTVGKQLIIELHKRHFPNRVPVFISSDQWTRLPQGADLSIWDVWKEAVNSMYSAIIGTDEFDLYVETGLLIPIFDGFDELCTRYGGSFRPSEVVEQLLTLLEDTDGRILLTTRDSFWSEHMSQHLRESQVAEFVLRPFTQSETTEYLSKRFPKAPMKQAAATQVLSRLATAATRPANASADETLTSLPLVIAMASESVDISEPQASINKYGSILEGQDPLRGVLLMLMSRERTRQQLSVEAEEQYALFRALAFEVGPVFSYDDLRLFAASLSSIGEDEGQHMALRSHGILRRVANDLSFRYDFIAEYFVGQEIVDRLVQGRADIQLREQLGHHARGSSTVLSRAAQGLLMSAPVEWVAILTRSWETFGRAASPGARSGFTHLVLSALDQARPTDSRRQRMDALRSILGQSLSSVISGLYVEGPLSSLDFSGLSFVGCHFVSASFSGIRFDKDSVFVRCTFEKGLEIENCEGFHLASFEASCRIDVAAKDTIRARQTVGNRLSVTKDEIVASVRTALEKFRGPIGFRGIKRSALLRGQMTKSSIAAQVWDALETRGVIQFHHLAGHGQRAGVNVADDARLDAHNFLANSIVAGKVKLVIETLEAALIGKE